MENKEDMQRKLFELRMIRQQMEQISAQMNMISEQVKQVNQIKNNLQSLQSVKNTPAQTQIGPGVFVKSQITDASTVLINVGAGILVEKSIAEANTTLDKQIEEGEGFINQLQESLEHLEHESQHLQGKCDHE